MPRYQYACGTCEVSVDVDKPMSESAREEACPTCSSTMQRVFAANPVHFKDGTSGWSKTGYASTGITFRYKSGKRETVTYDPRKVKKH